MAYILFPKKKAKNIIDFDRSKYGELVFKATLQITQDNLNSPDSDKLTYGFYFVGLCELAAGNKRQAREYFKRVKERSSELDIDSAEFIASYSQGNGLDLLKKEFLTTSPLLGSFYRKANEIYQNVESCRVSCIV